MAKKATEELKSVSAGVTESTQENLVIEDTITYKLTLLDNGYEFENKPSVGADLAGLIICKRIHEDMIGEIDKLKDMGIQPQFKATFQNRRKDLVKSIHTIDKSIKHLFKFAAKNSLK